MENPSPFSPRREAMTKKNGVELSLDPRLTFLLVGYIYQGVVQYLVRCVRALVEIESSLRLSKRLSQLFVSAPVALDQVTTSCDSEHFVLSDYLQVSVGV